MLELIEVIMDRVTVHDTLDELVPLIIRTLVDLLAGVLEHNDVRLAVRICPLLLQTSLRKKRTVEAVGVAPEPARTVEQHLVARLVLVTLVLVPVGIRLTGQLTLPRNRQGTLL